MDFRSISRLALPVFGVLLLSPAGAGTLEAEASRYAILRDIGQYSFTAAKAETREAQTRAVQAFADGGMLASLHYPGPAKRFKVQYFGSSKLLNDPAVTVLWFADDKWLLHEVLGINGMMDVHAPVPAKLGKSNVIGHGFADEPEGVAWVNGNLVIDTSGAYRFRAREVVEAYLRKYPSEVPAFETDPDYRRRWAVNETTRLAEHISRALEEPSDAVFPKGKWIYVHGEIMGLQAHLNRFWPDKVEAHLTNNVYRGLEKLKELALAKEYKQFQTQWDNFLGWWKEAWKAQPTLK